MSDIENTTVTKVCKQCNEEKIITEFYLQKDSKGGHVGRCKKCYSLNINRENKSATDKLYREANKEKISAKKKLYREENKEKVAACLKSWYERNKEHHASYQSEYYKKNKELTLNRQRSYYEENKEQVLEYHKSYYENNKELCSLKGKVWRKNNPEVIAAYSRNYKARKKNAYGTHTADDINNILILQKNKCAACCTSISNGYHVDHVIALANGGSNDKYNLQLLCARCNRSKSDKDPIEFMQSRGKLL